MLNKVVKIKSKSSMRFRQLLINEEFEEEQKDDIMTAVMER